MLVRRLVILVRILDDLKDILPCLILLEWDLLKPLLFLAFLHLFPPLVLLRLLFLRLATDHLQLLQILLNDYITPFSHSFLLLAMATACSLVHSTKYPPPILTMTSLVCLRVTSAKQTLLSGSWVVQGVL